MEVQSAIHCIILGHFAPGMFLRLTLRPIPIVGLLLLSAIGSVCGQDAPKDDRRVEQNIDSLRIIRVEGKNFRFTPFIAPSYSPELQLLISAGGLMTFSLQKENPLVSRSSIPFAFGYSTNGAITANVKANVFGREDKWRLQSDLWIKNMPDHYWGVGYENATTVPKSDSTTLYERDWFKFVARLGFHVGEGGFYVGPILDINNTRASNVNPRMAQDPDFLLIGSRSRNTGIGILGQYDTRDFPVNAYDGIYINLDLVFYGEILGGENQFTTIEIDYRQYLELKPRKVLAWQVRARSATGESPWTEKSIIGSPWDLRGYFWGRFRDDFMNFLLVEYRHMFTRKRPNKAGNYNSRFGFVAWTGQGVIGPEWTRELNWVPNVGVGLRFEVQPRMNVRIDYGVGNDASSIYFSFNEAF